MSQGTLFPGVPVASRKPFRLPFGCFKGVRLADAPSSYLRRLLLRWEPIYQERWQWLARLIEQELDRRSSGADGSGALTHAPVSWPRNVCGLALDEFEAWQFEQAVLQGELLLTLDLPCASLLPEAWRRWCREQGVPQRVREEKP